MALDWEGMQDDEVEAMVDYLEEQVATLAARHTKLLQDATDGLAELKQRVMRQVDDGR